MIVERERERKRERERQKEREEREKAREIEKKRQRLCRSTLATTRIARDLRESHEGDSYSIIDRDKDRGRDTRDINICGYSYIWRENEPERESEGGTEVTTYRDLYPYMWG